MHKHIPKLLRKIEVLVALGYGLISGATYGIVLVTHGDREATWVIMYFIARPISWLTNQVCARAFGYLPFGIASFLHESQVIVAGMLWFYALTWTLKFAINVIAAKVRGEPRKRLER
jgi:hypothetical protein